MEGCSQIPIMDRNSLQSFVVVDPRYMLDQARIVLGLVLFLQPVVLGGLSIVELTVLSHAFILDALVELENGVSEFFL